MRIAAAVFIALVLVPVAFAKGRIRLSIGDSTPKLGQPFAVRVRTDYVVPPNDWLRVIAIPPGETLGVGLGREGTALIRTSPTTWRAVLRLNRPGRWRIVIPNGTHVGYVTPVPEEWMRWVRVHR